MLSTYLNRLLAGRIASESGLRGLLPRHLLGRIYLFAAVLTLDCVWVACIPHAVLFGSVASFGIVCYAVFLGLGYSQLKLHKEDIPFNAWFFAAHLLCILAVFLASWAWMHGFSSVIDSVAVHLAVRAVLLAGIALLALACIPLRTWIAAIRSTSPSWLFALLAGAVAGGLRHPFQSLWSESSSSFGGMLQAITFQSVYASLRFFSPRVLADPATFAIGTSRFAVIIAKECSGLEGLGLVLVFTIVWLAYFRKENRFPQALLLIPCALIAVWALNVVRISLLILIGSAGAPEVAMVGFHSQAGWIAFTTVAFAFSMASQNLAWVRKTPVRKTPSAATGAGVDPALAATSAETPVAQEETRESPATGAYLIPFLAILAASFVSKAASGYFEWLYPLRFVAAAIALWFSRAELKKLNWCFGLMAPLTGAAIFLMWIAPTWWTKEPASSPLGAGLAAVSPAARLTWIVFRVAAAVITVPIAEELAFRGYLARRLIDREFDAVHFSSLTFLSIGVSSVVFGILHGQHWMAGIVAGVAFAAVLKSRGRFGDAVIAHTVSNLLLAVWVLLRGDWAQW